MEAWPSPSKNPLGKNVLVVENDQGTRKSLTLLLEGEGYTVAVVNNGKEALDYLRHFSPPDLILLDLSMPVLGGFEFRQEQQRTPAIAAIGH